MNRDSPQIDQILKETFVARAEFHETLTSTNDRAKECAAEGAGGLPRLIVAAAQTAGRGRAAHRWWTGSGSLAMSLLLDLGPGGNSQASQSPLLSLATAVTLVETVAPMLPSHTVGIHWPNDVLAGGGKLAGILIEVLADGLCVLGIGVNTNNRLTEAPPELRETAASLRELTGRQLDQTSFVVSLLGRLEGTLRQLASEREQIGTRADAICLQHGKTLTLQLGKRTITGRCAGIAPDGALLLDTPQGREAFYSGTLQAR